MEYFYLCHVNFESLKITRSFLNAIEELGYTDPTPIQLKAIPLIRGGKDIIGIAQTGTGKTAAYLLPILQKLNYAQGIEPRVLVLVPTKELVIQVTRNATDLAMNTDLRVLGLYGGVGPKTQMEALSKGSDVLIATPGRFYDLYHRGGIFTKKIKRVVLDEADRMMDMGFFHQIKKIQEILPSKRQNLLFSATFPEKVETLCEDFLLWPEKIEITPQSTPVTTVTQQLYAVPNFKTKLNLLVHFLNSEPEAFHRILVFLGTKNYAKGVSKYLERKVEGDIRVIHSDKGQNSRLNAMRDFKEGSVRVLVSTDVSARGIDVPDVSHVVNFTVPTHYEDYVHRIGRTGRARKLGMAITFMDKSEKFHVKKIEELIGQSITYLQIPEEVEIEATPREERQLIARELDRQRRMIDPDFKGAFHERKSKEEKRLKKKRKREKLKRRK